jgi:hypothetical protein
MHVYLCVAWQRTSYIPNAFARYRPSTVASIRVYGSGAWQPVDKIRYNTDYLD